MLNVDEFESVFRAADKKSYKRARPNVDTVLVLTDLSGDEHDAYVQAVEELLEPLALREALEDKKLIWETRGAGEWQEVDGVLALVAELKPDLIVTYRNLNSSAWKYCYSLGVYLSALHRAVEQPVVITPHPKSFPDMAWRSCRTDSVMVINDSLTGDDGLVNWGVALTRPAGKLHLCHMEHDEIFARYIDAISKIPEIDTDTARETIREYLLKEPTEYIETVRACLAEHKIDLEVVPHVTMGHRVVDYRGIVEAEEVDIVVVPTLEEDRIALHGVAYSLAVEMVSTPLLMV